MAGYIRNIISHFTNRNISHQITNKKGPLTGQFTQQHTNQLCIRSGLLAISCTIGCHPACSVTEKNDKNVIHALYHTDLLPELQPSHTSQIWRYFLGLFIAIWMQTMANVSLLLWFRLRLKSDPTLVPCPISFCGYKFGYCTDLVFSGFKWPNGWINVVLGW